MFFSNIHQFSHTFVFIRRLFLFLYIIGLIIAGFVGVFSGYYVALLLIAFGAFAGYLPAKRAASIKPIEALRDD